MNIDLGAKSLSIPIIHTMIAGAILGFTKGSPFENLAYLSWLIWIPFIIHAGYRMFAISMFPLFYWHLEYHSFSQNRKENESIQPIRLPVLIIVGGGVLLGIVGAVFDTP